MSRRSSTRSKLFTAPRTIIGYHGCSRETAEIVMTENPFLHSSNTYDWLGAGVYFWEYAPFRALEWARKQCLSINEEPVVLKATIQLGHSLNLLDLEHFDDLEAVYIRLTQSVNEQELSINTSSGAHFLDRFIIDAYCRWFSKELADPFQTVRGCFPEGEPIYPGSKILSKTHTQIAVRDLSCISRINLVQFE